MLKLGKQTLVMAGALLLIALNQLSCGRGPKKSNDMPDLLPCVAVVKFRGEPVSNAKVLFSPVSGRFSAAGLTDSQGRAVMKAEGSYDGVVPGSYKVAILSQPVSAQTQTQSGESSADPEEYAKQFLASATTSDHKVQSTLPSKYASFESSGLLVTVNTDSGREVVFDLKD